MLRNFHKPGLLMSIYPVYAMSVSVETDPIELENESDLSLKFFSRRRRFSRRSRRKINTKFDATFERKTKTIFQKTRIVGALRCCTFDAARRPCRSVIKGLRSYRYDAKSAF